MDTAVFKDLKIVVSTPTMGMQTADVYSHSRAELERYLTGIGIGFYPSRSNDTYLPRARDILANAMLATDASLHLFLDSDMGWDNADVMRMLYHAVTRPDIEILGAAYPQKSIDWNRVKDAVIRNPRIMPKQLAAVAQGSWTFRGLDSGRHDMGAPIELKKIGDQYPHVATGIMLIKRSAYDKLAKVSSTYFDSQFKKQTINFFDCRIENGQRVGEDVWFCRRAYDEGVKIWVAPWVKTEHVGPYSFVGDIGQVIDAGMELPV